MWEEVVSEMRRGNEKRGLRGGVTRREDRADLSGESEGQCTVVVREKVRKMRIGKRRDQRRKGSSFRKVEEDES